jgi:hypothetical protein
MHVTSNNFKEIDKKYKETISPERRTVMEQIEKALDECSAKVNKAKSVDEAKTAIKEYLIKIQQDETPLKEGEAKISQSKEAIVNLKYEGKSLDEIKREVNSEISASRNLKKEILVDLFKDVWDDTRKVFITSGDKGEVFGTTIKKAARAIQGKFAIAYGAIGAGALGLAGYFFGSTKKETPQEAPKQ